MSNREDFFKQCVVLDTETTSKSYSEAEVIESGFVIHKDGLWNTYQELHKPENGLVPPEIQALTYITTAMVVDKPEFKDSKDQFQDIMNLYSDGYAIGHNYFYDMKVLERYDVKLPSQSICTWRLSKKLFKDVPEIKETNLPYLRFALELDIPLELHCHRAGTDSLITAKLLEVMIDIMESSNILDTTMPYGPQIMDFCQKPIIYDTWPMGKHKGQKFKDIPASYFNWAINNVDILNPESDSYDDDMAQSLVIYLDNELQ